MTLIAGHGMSDTPMYMAWDMMVRRRTDPNAISYKTCGAKGIKVCERWLSFANFLEDMGERPAGCSLDRIDNGGDYEPSNCRWATRAEQARNTSRNKMVTFNGRTLCLKDWARDLSLPYSTIHMRVRRGMDPVEALKMPILPPGEDRRTQRIRLGLEDKAGVS